MKKIVFFLLIAVFSLYGEELKVDKVNFKDNSIEIILHNISEPEKLQLMLNGAKFEAYKLTVPDYKNLYYVLADNSGSIRLEDFLEMRSRLQFIVSKMGQNDLLKIFKINDSHTVIYGLSDIKDGKAGDNVRNLVREGRKSRIYDTINDIIKEQQRELSSSDYSQYYPYIILFSDGDDIGSLFNPADLKSETPFFYFNYFSKADPSKNTPLIKLAESSAGKVISRPTEKDITDLFFNKQKRYNISVSFTINEKEVRSKKNYVLAIVDGADSTEIDLKQYYKDEQQKISARKNSKDKKTPNGDTEDSPIRDLTPSEEKAAAGENVGGKSVDNDKSGSESGTAGRDENGNAGLLSVIGENDTVNKLMNIKFFNIPLLYIIAGFLLLLLILIIFLIVRALSGGSKGKRSSGGGSAGSRRTFVSAAAGAPPVQTSASTSKTEKKETPASAAKPAEVKKSVFDEQQKEEDEDEENEEGDAEENPRKPEDIKQEAQIVPAITIGKVSFKMIKDLMKKERLSKFQLLNIKNSAYIDNAERHGEEMSVNSDVKLTAVNDISLTASTGNKMLLEEEINLKNIKFLISRIKYDQAKNISSIELTPRNSGIDLKGLFKINEDVDGVKKMRIFGGDDAAVEKIVNRLGVHIEKPDFTEWNTGSMSNDMDHTVLVTDKPLDLDTVFEMKDAGGKVFKFIVKSVKKSEQNYAVTIKYI